jgi:hypothetical protein
MLTPFLMLGLTLTPGVGEPLKQAPLVRSLFENDDAYKGLAAQEAKYEGVLEFSPSNGLIGIPANFHAFQLSWTEDGKIHSRPINMQGKDTHLAPFVGHRVQLFGKLSEREVDGQKLAELIPGKLEVHGQVPYGVLGDVKILARTPVQFLNVIRRGIQPEVVLIRDGGDLASRMGYGGTNADRSATTAASQRIGFNIDWEKHIMLHISGGQQRVAGAQVKVTSATMGVNGIDIKWKLEVPNNVGVSISYPQETILIPAFKGEIRVTQEGAKGPMQIFQAIKD